MWRGQSCRASLGPFSKWSTVQKKQCATCIYRADSGFELKKLEAEVEIADPSMEGFSPGIESAIIRGPRAVGVSGIFIGRISQPVRSRNV